MSASDFMSLMDSLTIAAQKIKDLLEKFNEAEDKLTLSAKIWNELGFRFFAGRDLLLLATVYHGSGNLNKSDESLNKAMELFTHLGAKMYAQKVLARKELLKA